MPVATVPFSNPQYQLEVTVNIVGTSSYGTYSFVDTDVQVAIRRVSGSGAGLSGSGDRSIGDGSHGDTVPMTYDLTASNYQLVPGWSNFQVSYSTYPAGTNATITVTVTDPTSGKIGTATAQVVFPMPIIGNTTIPTFSSTNVNAGSTLTITLPRKVSTYTHTISYSFGTLKDVVLTTTATTSYAWAIPLSILAEIPNAPSGVANITTVTKDSTGNEVGRITQDINIMVPASQAPTVTSYTLANVTDANTPVSPASAWVQNISNVRVDAIDATATHGAAIVERRLSIEGANLPIGAKRKLLNSGSVPFAAQAWDSRGLMGQLTGTLDVQGYFAPRLNSFTVVRSDSAGTPVEDGQYVRVSINATRSTIMDGAVDVNTLTTGFRYRELGTTTWSAIASQETTASPTTVARAVTLGTGTTFLNTKSYEIQLIMNDTLSTTTPYLANRIVATGYVTMMFDGTNVGIGKSWVRGKLDVAGQVFATGMGLRYVGTTAERDAMNAFATAGMQFRTTNTTPALNWEWSGSAWLLVPGQILASMVGPTTNTTGAAGTIVGTVISTTPLPIGQRVKIMSNFSQFDTASAVSNIETKWRNNAADVTSAAFDGVVSSRAWDPAGSIVVSGRGCAVLYTTTAAAKISSALYLAGPTSAVYGFDGTHLWIESA